MSQKKADNHKIITKSQNLYSFPVIVGSRIPDRVQRKSDPPGTVQAFGARRTGFALKTPWSDGTRHLLLFPMELRRRGAIAKAVEGMGVVAQLAVDPQPDASWECLLGSNIVGSRNVLEAALEELRDPAPGPGRRRKLTRSTRTRQRRKERWF